MKKTILTLVIAGLLIASWWIWSQRPGTVREGWLTYDSEDLGFSIQYSPDMKIIPHQQPPRTISFVYIGPTQSLGTELYDGVNLTIRRDELNGNISKYIEKEMEQTRNVGEVASPLEPVEINGMNGFAYSARTLGEYRLIFLEDGDDVVVISYITPDPKNLGYQKIAEDMLSTLQLK